MTNHAVTVIFQSSKPTPTIVLMVGYDGSYNKMVLRFFDAAVLCFKSLPHSMKCFKTSNYDKKWWDCDRRQDGDLFVFSLVWLNVWLTAEFDVSAVSVMLGVGLWGLLTDLVW